MIKRRRNVIVVQDVENALVFVINPVVDVIHHVDVVHLVKIYLIILIIFFGENSQCKAGPCFSDWLIKNVKTADELQKVDREALQKKITNCGR